MFSPTVKRLVAWFPSKVYVQIQASTFAFAGALNVVGRESTQPVGSRWSFGRLVRQLLAQELGTEEAKEMRFLVSQPPGKRDEKFGF